MNRNPIDKAITALRNEQPELKTMEAAGERVWSKLAAEPSEEFASAMAHHIRGCADVQSLLPMYVRGRMEGSKALLVGDHLRECSECLKVSNKLQNREDVGPWRSALPVVTSGWGMRQFATAAVLLFVIGASYFGVRQAFFTAPAGPRAHVETVKGSVFLIASNADRPLLPGTELADGEALRTAGASYATLRLSDGSLVEVNERSEFSVTARRNDTTIHMQAGNIIVQAAKRRTGHLYVMAKDCRVSVTGTVFAVNSGVKGSRVSVMEGEVRVTRAAIEDILHSGDQVTTTPAISKVAIRDEIAWSRNFDKHLALLAEFSKLQQKISNVPTPGPRYDSRILKLVPRSSVLYASIPNYGEALKQAHQLFQEQLTESPVLRQWWSRQNGSRDGQPTLDEMINRIYTLSQYVGNEIVISVADTSSTHHGMPVVIAEVKNAGLRSFLDSEISRLQPNEKDGVRALNDEELASYSSENRQELLILVRPDFVVASPDVNALRSFVQAVNGGGSQFETTGLGQVMASAYQEGIGIVVGADLQRMTAQGRKRDRFSHYSVNGGPGNDVHISAFNRSGFENMKYLVATRRENGNTSDNRVVLSFNGERHGIASWLSAPSPMSTLDFVSPSASAAAAITVKNPAAMFDDVLSLLGDDAHAKRELQDAEAKLNIRLRDDLAATLGNEFTIAIDGPMLPTPSWKVIGEVYDQSRLQSTIATLIDDVNRESSNSKHPVRLSLQRQEIDGRIFYTIQSQRNSMNPDVHYTFVDGYIILAPSRALILQAIRTRESGATLPRSETFMSLLPTDGHTNFSGVIYQNLGSVLGAATEQLNPNQTAKLQAIVANSKPSLICAYGNADTIEMASTGLVVMNLDNLAIADVLRTLQGNKKED
jgi:hypothetical protein